MNGQRFLRLKDMYATVKRALNYRYLVLFLVDYVREMLTALEFGARDLIWTRLEKRDSKTSASTKRSDNNNKVTDSDERPPKCGHVRHSSTMTEPETTSTARDDSSDGNTSRRDSSGHDYQTPNQAINYYYYDQRISVFKVDKIGDDRRERHNLFGKYARNLLIIGLIVVVLIGLTIVGVLMLDYSLFALIKMISYLYDQNVIFIRPYV